MVILYPKKCPMQEFKNAELPTLKNDGPTGARTVEGSYSGLLDNWPSRRAVRTFECLMTVLVVILCSNWLMQSEYYTLTADRIYVHKSLIVLRMRLLKLTGILDRIGCQRNLVPRAWPEHYFTNCGVCSDLNHRSIYVYKETSSEPQYTCTGLHDLSGRWRWFRRLTFPQLNLVLKASGCAGELSQK
jgi:hypothetical protein